jgi:hypothetical protein
MTRNKLLVEGDDDKHAVIQLMSAHTPWPKSKNTDDWPVWVHSSGGVEKLLQKRFLSEEIKVAGSDPLGIIIDADENAQNRWAAVRNRCVNSIPDLPETIPPGGLIHKNKRGGSFGVWIMPNNSQSGMIETFLSTLRVEKDTRVWDHAIASTTQAKSLGASFTNAHVDKARIHTWLAWQEPVGRSFGIAITENCLNAKSPFATPFVTWFKKLFNLPDLAS